MGGYPGLYTTLYTMGGYPLGYTPPLYTMGGYPGLYPP